MNFAEKAFRQTINRLVLIQSVLVVGLALVLYGFFDKTSDYSTALVYGGLVSIAVTIIRAWRLKIATEHKDSDSQSGSAAVSALELYKGFLLGYIVAIGLLALGLGALKLQAAAVIIGFIAAQLGHFFVRPPRPGAARR